MVFKRPQSRIVMNSAMCNLLLRSWGELSQEDAAQRNILIGLYFDALTRDFRELTPSTKEVKVKKIADGTLPVLAHTVEYSKKFTNASKKLLCGAIKVSNFL